MLRLSTLPRYLIGSRSAIREIIEAPHALTVGFLFVLSAALARTWDTVDLIDSPETLLRPVGASLASSTLIFLVIFGILAARHRLTGDPRVPMLRAWRRYLALFWWTAPLAWVYAIPVEHALTVADSVAMNMWLLTLVSAWRVALIVRAISVLFDVSAMPTAFLVLFLADAIALAAIALTPVPVFLVMGGIDVDNPEAVLAANLFHSQILLILAFIPLAVCAIGGAFSVRSSADWKEVAPLRTAGAVWALAAIAIVAFLVLSTSTQPALRRATRLREMSLGADAAGFATLSEGIAEVDLPPHWRPTLEQHRRGGDSEPAVMQRILALQEAIASSTMPSFMRVRVERTIDGRLRRQLGLWRAWSGDDHVAYNLIRAVEHAPTIADALRRHGREASILTDDDRRTIEEILGEAERTRGRE